MTAPVLADELGPRARRRVQVATVVSAVVLAAVVVVAVRRLYDRGQLDVELWEPFTQLAVIRFLGVGLLNTLKAALTAMLLAMVVGGAMALGRLARNLPTRWVSGIYVEFFRAVPLLLLILFSGLGLPRLGVDWPVFWYVVLGLTLYNSAVLGEIFRAGILSLDRGQFEAASSIGLSYWRSMMLVIIPQAARRMVPAIVSQLITLLKDTALAFVITYEEFLRRARFAGEAFRNPLQAFVVVACVYIAVNLVLSRIARRLEVRQRRRLGAAAIHTAGLSEELAVMEVADVDAGGQAGRDRSPQR